MVWQNDCRRRYRLLVALDQVLVASFFGFDQNLAKGERGCHQLILTLDHPLAQGNNPRGQRGIAQTGTLNYGGPVVTASGLVFIAATMDSKIRAFDTRGGELLWTVDLPASAYSTPAVYAVDGRQYLALACGGGKLGSKSGDAHVAFALPIETQPEASGWSIR